MIMVNGKTALVTGASSGIGEALAEHFAADGYNLILAARNVAKMDEIAARLVERYKVAVEVVGVDLETIYGAQALHGATKRLGVEIDALVNNAGYGLHGEFKNSALSDQLKMMQLNMASLVSLTRLFLPDLIARKGRILNLASTAAFQPGPTMAVYCATKAFVLSFSEAIGAELAGDGVTVTALCPGATATGFAARADAGDLALFNVLRPMTAESVAAIGYSGFRRGRRVVITGALNWIMAQGIRLTPRLLAANIAMRLMQRV